MFHLALYGCGNRTKALINSLILDKFYDIGALFDLNGKAMETMQAQFGGKICRTEEELLECRNIDAYLISLSPFAHEAALRKVIPLGKPVFVEKPVAFSSKTVLELAELADRYHTPVQVGFMRRYCPWNEAALEYQKTHDPGRLLCIKANWHHQGDTEMLHCLRNNPDNFRLKVSQISYHCCHALDVILQHGGKLKTLRADLLKVIDRPYPSPDELLSTFEFQNGSLGGFHYSSMCYGFGEISYMIHAENYSIRIRGGVTEISHRPKFETSRQGLDNNCAAAYRINSSPTTLSFGDRTENTTTENIMYDFVRTVTEGVKPEADLYAALRVEGMAEAMEYSGYHGGITLTMDELGCPIISE